MNNYTDTEDFIRQRLQESLARPDGWGTPDCVEFQILLLVEAAHVAAGKQEQRKLTLGRYYRHLHSSAQVPLLTFSLVEYLGLTGARARATREFVNVLREFVEKEMFLANDGSSKCTL